MAVEEIKTEADLDDALSRPSPALVDMMGRIDGDIVILGIAGKMGVTLGMMALRAVRESGVERRVIGVARFSNPEHETTLREFGLETIRCDLLDPTAVASLPDADNIIYMVGRKFGTQGDEAMTWAINTVVPSHVARRYATSRIVMFSTGCVYPFVPSTSDGPDENVGMDGVGDYAQAAVARERVFQYYSESGGTPILMYRLNYAIDLRYGVLHDIAQLICNDQPVDLTMPCFNCIWQRDANDRALRCLERCASPPAVLNVTGPESHDLRETALALADKLGKTVSFTGTPSETTWLSNASKSIALFGPPETSIEDMIEMTATWITLGGSSLGKPTHFEVADGKY